MKKILQYLDSPKGYFITAFLCFISAILGENSTVFTAVGATFFIIGLQIKKSKKN